MNPFPRILALIKKELHAILRDPKSRKIVILPVLIQGLILPLAATLEVKNATLAVRNEDGGAASVELVQRIGAGSAFTHVLAVTDEGEVARALDGQDALAVVEFPPDFTKRVESGEPAPIGVWLDGRRSNSGQIAAAYITEIAAGYFAERAAAKGLPPRAEPPVVRHRYNPNLDHTWFVMPCIVAIILTISSLILTALSVAREREQGTFEQLLVSPLSPGMIMVGKAASALLVGMAQCTAVILLAVFLYGVPLHGSLALLYAAATLYFITLAGFGLLISSVCSTQQQAFLGAFAFMMPAILLSGFAAPVENMPEWIQVLNLANPIRHYIVILKGIFLKDASALFVLRHAMPLMAIAACTMTLAAVFFRRRMG